MFKVSELDQGEDLNGDGDTDDWVVHLADLTALAALSVFLRGDCNDDGFVGGNVVDSLFYLNWAFGTGPDPACIAACDADGDGFVGGSVNDAVYYLNWAFTGGKPPPAPFPECGPGTAEDAELGCETPPECTVEVECPPFSPGCPPFPFPFPYPGR